MMNRLFVRVAMVLVMAAVSGGVGGGVAVAGDEVHFGYEFSEGFTESYKIKFSQELSFGQFSMSAFVDAEVSEKCVAVEEGNKYRFEMTFNKLESSMMQFEKMVPNETMEGLSGQTISYVVDAHGEVNDVKPLGYVENWSRVEQQVEQMIQYPYMPNEAVEIGAMWKEEDKVTESDEAGKMVTNSTFSFKKMKKENGRECAEVAGESVDEISGTSTNPMGTFAMEGEGKGEFEFYFDPATSFIVKLKGKYEVKMVMTPESGGDSQDTIVYIEMERELL